MQQGFDQKTITLGALCQALEAWAPPALQEDYDNSGLLVGDRQQAVTGVLVSLDLTEAVIEEALAKGCNVVVSHHPVIFGKLKRLTGADWVQRCVIKAIKADVALYAIHTNLDHIQTGVSAKMAALLQLQNTRILQPKQKILLKLVTFVPQAQAEAVREALFAAGAGQIGKYHRASFNLEGMGTYEPMAGAKPFSGEVGKLQQEAEVRIEVHLEHWKKAAVLKALLAAHPYEEVAYDLIALENVTADYGAGMLGELPAAMSEIDFLQLAKKCFGGTVRYSPLTGQPIHKVALCGGSGSFLLPDALQAGAQVLLTADHKYHQFFEADGRILLADFGHYETEQFTKDLIANYLSENFTNFAVLISETNTNPVNYL
ncbi:MAG: Nif3-like dinuclear metal center hexameric protein [Sphingobacteriaceae bacterium]|nr:Nif3-like dinuclear metal center hexameric protein [Sphingobacteriaceae bacterium]